MTFLTRAFLAALLLLSAAAPVAAVDEATPEPVPVECDAALGCEILVDPIPVLEAPVDCAPELAAAVAAGETPIAPAPCLLPDGTLYELAARGIDPAPNERGSGDETDWAAMYEQWMADYAASLEPCPEGTAPDAMDVATCRLPDGTIVGPMPLFAAMPDAGIATNDDEAVDISTTAAEEESGIGSLGLAAAGIAVVATAAVVLRMRRSTR